MRYVGKESRSAAQKRGGGASSGEISTWILKRQKCRNEQKSVPITKHRATFFFHLSRTTTSSKSAKVSTTRTRAHTRGVAPKREARAI